MIYQFKNCIKVITMIKQNSIKSLQWFYILFALMCSIVIIINFIITNDLNINLIGNIIIILILLNFILLFLFVIYILKEFIGRNMEDYDLL